MSKKIIIPDGVVSLRKEFFGDDTSFAFRNSVIELLVFPQKMLRCQCQGLISSLQAYGAIIMDWSIK